MVHERKTNSLFMAGCTHLKNFQSFVEMLGLPYGVSLPFPSIDGETDESRLSFVKKFCGGLLEHPREHLWHGPTKRLSSDTRMSIAMSLFLYRKVLPSGEPDLIAYAERMAQPSPEPDSRFLNYVRSMVPKLFPVGWDKGLYENASLNATIPAKSCRQLGMSRGGARFYALGERWNSHQDYVLDVLTREDPIQLLPSRVVSVETGGKHRVVSVSDVNANLFRPLHASMYNHLSKFPWLLRGDAKPSRFKGFESRSGEVFVSGDYESATDNLNGHLQREILDLILAQTTSVPKGILESAPSMLRSVLEVKKDGVDIAYQQERGQLMGNLLSFPLLCLVNYLGFRFFSKCRGPVRINGDDIVFRATAQQAKDWMEKVSACGLTLSKGKTLVHARYFSLNSCMFKACLKEEGKPQLIPMIRSTAFGYRTECGGVESIAGRFRSFAPGFYGNRREMLRIRFLQWNRKYVLASRRSLTRGLGIRVTKSELIASGLWEREAHYLSLPKGVETPLPAKVSRLEQDRIPDGWELRPVARITKEIRLKTREAGPLFVECAWSSPRYLGPVSENAWRSDIVRTGYSWSPEKSPLKKRARLLGLSPRNAQRYLRIRLQESDLRRIAEEYRRRVWLPKDWLTTSQMKARPAMDGLCLASVISFVKAEGRV